jgi:DNA repair protein RadC
VRQLLITYQPIEGTLNGRQKITSGGDAACYLRPLLEHESQEVFMVLLLDTRNQVIAVHTISRGTLDATMVHPRDVFKAACLSNAAGIITAHNHPSGIATPSPDDQMLWAKLNAAADVMGIPIHEHLIIGHAGQWYGSLTHGGQLR